MLKLNIKAILTFLVPLLVSLITGFQLHATEAIPKCSARPEAVSSPAPNVRNSIIFKNLPQKVFVAKSADYYVESKTGDSHLWSRHSFLKGTSQFLCADSDRLVAKNFSLYAPTLMDLRSEQKISDSYWQFRMISNSKHFGIWNQKSRVFAKAKDLESSLLSQGLRLQFFELNDTSYEMLLTRESENFQESLIIRFDVVSEL